MEAPDIANNPFRGLRTDSLDLIIDEAARLVDPDNIVAVRSLANARMARAAKILEENLGLIDKCNEVEASFAGQAGTVIPISSAVKELTEIEQ